MRSEIINNNRIIRLAKWDNAKAMLIFLVVLGHIAEKYTDNNSRVGALFVAIYLFHMPAFIFISGMFSKKLINSERFRWDKWIPYLYMSFALNYYRVLTQRPWNPDLEFQPFLFKNVSWYFFVIFVYIFVTRLIRKVPNSVIIAISIIIACSIGYVNGMPQVFYRLGLLFPYYYLGYVLDAERTAKLLNNKRIKAASYIILASWLAMCLLFSLQIYSLRRLITNANSYGMAGLEDTPMVWTYRLVDIALVIIVTFSIFSIVPKIKLPVISGIGSATLPIYFWHLGLVEIITHADWFNSLIETGNLVLLMSFILASALIVVILSSRVFAIPLEYGMKAPAMMLEKTENLKDDSQ